MLTDSFISICGFSTYADLALYLSTSSLYSFGYSYEDLVEICKNLGYNSLRCIGNGYWIKIDSITDSLPFQLCLSK